MIDRVIISGFIGLIGLIWLKYEYDLGNSDKSWKGFLKHLWSL